MPSSESTASSQPDQTEPEEDGPIDLLSISQLATPEPELPPEPEPLPPPEAPPPVVPSATSPPPVQPVVPEVYPHTPPPQPENPEISEALPSSPAFDTPEATAEPTSALTTDQQETLQLTTRLTRGAGDSNFDVTATLFPFGAWPTISQWSAAEAACFFAEISEETFQLPAGAADVRFLSRNMELVEREDLPRTFPAPEFQLNRMENGYCDRTFYEVVKNGQPVLFLSVIGIGPGNPPATVLVMFWSADPRRAGG